MRLYVCYGVFGPLDTHACGAAHQALTAAGHRPSVHRTDGRPRTRRFRLPRLVLSDGAVIDGASQIVVWAERNRRSARADP
jgi:hypothetical protein